MALRPDCTVNFFDVLGVKPVLVISEKLWRRRFWANPAVIGRAMELNRHGFTTIGVVPTAFTGRHRRSLSRQQAAHVVGPQG